MKYRVIIPFPEPDHKNHYYRIGEEFPAPGFTSTQKRLDSLASNKNGYGKPVLEVTGKPESKLKLEPEK